LTACGVDSGDDIRPTGHCGGGDVPGSLYSIPCQIAFGRRQETREFIGLSRIQSRASRLIAMLSCNFPDNRESAGRDRFMIGLMEWMAIGATNHEIG
jgi:hypothetical protein